MESKFWESDLKLTWIIMWEIGEIEKKVNKIAEDFSFFSRISNYSNQSFVSLL